MSSVSSQSPRAAFVSASGATRSLSQAGRSGVTRLNRKNEVGDQHAVGGAAPESPDLALSNRGCQGSATVMRRSIEVMPASAFSRRDGARLVDVSLSARGHIVSIAVPGAMVRGGIQRYYLRGCLLP